jgi:hypothetical protein
VCECRFSSAIRLENVSAIHLVWCAIQIFYFEEIRVFKAGLRYEYISME